MSEWKEIKTMADIPDAETWDRYEWKGVSPAGRAYDMPDYPREIQILSDGRVLNIDDDYISYRPKPWPIDEYIESQVWEVRKNTWITYKAIHSQTTSTASVKVTENVYFDTNDVMGSEMRSRVWFQDANHFPKSEIKHGIER